MIEFDGRGSVIPPDEFKERFPQDYLVLAIGREFSGRICSLNQAKATPFIGVDRTTGQIGIGVVSYEDGGGLFDKMGSNDLISATLALRITEITEASDIQGLNVALDFLETDWQHERMDSPILDNVIGSVIAQAIDESEIERMARLLTDNHINFNIREIKEHILKGSMVTTPFLDDVVKNWDQEEAAFAIEFEKVKDPLPPEGSLFELLDEIGFPEVTFQDQLAMKPYLFSRDTEQQARERSKRETRYYAIYCFPRGFMYPLVMEAPNGDFYIPEFVSYDANGDITMLSNIHTHDGRVYPATLTVPRLREKLERPYLSGESNESTGLEPVFEAKSHKLADA